jgi:ABC-type siderophore export system fused ATPase/permease subunit
MAPSPLTILIIGILMLLGGLFFAMLSGKNFDMSMIGVFIAGIGGFLILLVVAKWRNRLYDWVNNR